MIKKLSNQEWQEKIEEYYTSYSFMPINKFCAENNLSKQQFHYHKKKRIKSESNANTLFQEVSFTSTEILSPKTIETKAEITISIGNSLIASSKLASHKGTWVREQLEIKLDDMRILEVKIQYSFIYI